MSAHLQNEIEKVKRLLLTLVSMVEEEFAKAYRALLEGDGGLAAEVSAEDEKIDHLEVDIEEECLKVLALHQPVAVDLRLLTSVLKINADLSRIGDLTVSIANNAIVVMKNNKTAVPDMIPAMSDRVKDILRKSLDAMVDMDERKAREVIEDDNAIDELHKKMKSYILEQIKSSPENAEALMALLQVSRRMERIADHAVHIAEDVIYMIDAEIIRHKEDVE